jgi:hypothetical protein
MQVGPNPFQQRIEADVVSDSAGHGALVLSTGVREFFGLDAFYGWNPATGLVPLGLTLSKYCDRVRVTVDSNIANVDLHVQLKTPNGGLYMASAGMRPSGSPYCIDYRFTDFVEPGVTPPFVQSGISEIALVIQSSSSVGADNFALRKVEFSDAAHIPPGGGCFLALPPQSVGPAKSIGLQSHPDLKGERSEPRNPAR